MNGKKKITDSEILFHNELDQLYYFVGVAGLINNVDNLFDDCLPPLISISQAEKAVLFMCKESDETLRPVSQIGWDNKIKTTLNSSEISPMFPEALQCISSKEIPCILLQVFADNTDPAIIIPLWLNGKLKGLLIFTRKNKPFSTRLIKLLCIAGRQLVLAVSNLELFSKLQISYNKLMDTQEDIIRSERLTALGGMAATMAHEIRNPLSTIFSAISQIKRYANLKGDTATLLEIAQEESEKLNEMVSCLLEYAKPQSPQIIETNPLEIAKESVGIVKTHLKYNEKIKIKIVCDEPEITGFFDPNLVGMALNHLLFNAIEAILPNKGQITLEVMKVTGSVSGVSFLVSDSGCGIQKDTMKNIFNPFSSSKATGTGLGLPIVKRIVDDHCGLLEISSDPGKLTTVKMVFINY